MHLYFCNKKNMSWEICSVTLNSDSTGSFYCGDIVTGSVTIHFKQKHIFIDRIDFIVEGISKAQWTRPSPTMPHIKIYSQKKKVLYMSLDVFEDLREKTVSANAYDFSFHFPLANDLPSTFESGIAKVNYCIKIKCHGAIKNKKIIPFVVLGNVNLNNIPHLLEPSYHEISKIFRNTGHISLLIKTFTGFACNQNIPLLVNVSNEKKVKIQKLSVSLIQKLRYSVMEGYADDEKRVCKIEKNDILNNEKEICKMYMVVPHTVPSSLHTIDPMIDISYFLRIKVKFMYHTSLIKDIPVSIATVPVLHSDFEDF